MPRVSMSGGVLIMPVIAISVTKMVADYYNYMKKGTRSKHFSNVLERHVRLSSNMEYPSMSYQQLHTVIQQREDAINKLQTIITDLNEQLQAKNKSADSKTRYRFWKSSR